MTYLRTMKKRYQKLSIGSCLSLGPLVLLAQTESSTGSMSRTYQDIGLYITVALTLAVILAAFIVLMRTLESLMKLQDPKADSVRSSSSVASTLKIPGWQKLYAQLTKSVPIEREREILLDHNYDGIRELDNRLPPWWLGMFYVTIVIGVLYYGYYHVLGKGMSSEEAWQAEMVEAKTSVQSYLASQGNVIDETNVELVTDDAALSAGEITYNTLCAVCHLESGAGLVGPNLTDEYWVHGGDIKDLFATIKYGVPEKGMIAWSNQLRPEQIQQVASYILNNLVGTTPENPKAPEGELYQREGI